MDPSQMEKKVSELSQSQRTNVHSVLKAPLFPKSHIRVDDSEDEATGLDNPSQTSTFPQLSPSAGTQSTREGNKEGTGRKLLNMLRKILKGSENNEVNEVQDMPPLVPFGDVVGCLGVHIKKCRHFSPRINLKYHSNLFIRITVNKIMKCTKAHSLNLKNSERKPGIRFEEVKYFSIQVPRRQDDERNMIYLELMEFDDLEAYPVLLGSFSLHLYEVIQKGCFTEEVFMKIRNLVVCKLEVEFMFSYGNFGFGFSHQLKPLQKLIQPSMFMHVPPPLERTDPLTNVITPQRIEYPAFLSPDLNVTVGTPQNQIPSFPVRLEKLQKQPRDRLDRMKKEYRNLKTWEEKSEYLDQILRMKASPKDFPGLRDSNSNNDVLLKQRESQFLANLFQPPEYSVQKQEDISFPSELPVKTPEVKKSLRMGEMRTDSPDSSLLVQDNAETKSGSHPPGESFPLPLVSLKGKDVCVESIERSDELIGENNEPEGETSGRQIPDSSSSEVKPKQSQASPEKMASIQSETKLKSSSLNRDRRKRSTDEFGLETKRQSVKQESKKGSEFLQILKEDTETISKVPLPRHVSFNILNETTVLLSSPALNKDEIEENTSLNEVKDRNGGEEKHKQGVGEKNEDEEESEQAPEGTKYPRAQGIETWRSNQ
ncbi:C2 calcium-dependent domain-containing protein 6-like [Gracilinanus agilis]|uniref:C2 calcium-dependent domain-containing protein 6-like n=1 Tax=Gracilinanus agilis TaxID=191870 RepID=UPI001CFCC396|nr:C2 calcium-dependent domain-containing protein 6-like [Gracilinanus agilis]